MKKNILFTLLFYFQVITISGQSRPFPQNDQYPHGYKPTTLQSSDAQEAYNKIKNSYFRECNGALRLIYEDENITRVEAVGFGMLLSAYSGDKEYFDRQYEFYKSKRTAYAKNLMGWEVTCDGFIHQGNASDGDIDVAFSLIVAYNQWGGDYLNEAVNIINIMKQWLIITCGDTIKALKPGTDFGGCYLTDIMYYTPAFFRIFAEVTGDNIWNTLADDTYRIRDGSAHPVTGLVPNWQSVNGTPSTDPSWIGYFAYDACRAPWREALDYLWNGDLRAKTWCTKVSNWAYSIGPANIMDGYNLDGTAHNGGNHNSAFTGGFAVAAMCNSQAIVNSFGTEMDALNDSYWFNLYTRALYLYTLTGNFWKPQLTVDIKQSEVKAVNLIISPNPANDRVIISGKIPLTDISCVLTDICGLVIRKYLPDSNGVISLSGIKPGMYILQISCNGLLLTKKIIKQQ